jgi:hypothetical protein
VAPLLLTPVDAWEARKGGANGPTEAAKVVERLPLSYGRVSASRGACPQIERKGARVAGAVEPDACLQSARRGSERGSRASWVAKGSETRQRKQEQRGSAVSGRIQRAKTHEQVEQTIPVAAACKKLSAGHFRVSTPQTRGKGRPFATETGNAIMRKYILTSRQSSVMIKRAPLSLRAKFSCQGHRGVPRPPRLSHADRERPLPSSVETARGARAPRWRRVKGSR